jgi:septal ring factor EnvC (AmiA/AmiB activator)
MCSGLGRLRPGSQFQMYRLDRIFRYRNRLDNCLPQFAHSTIVTYLFNGRCKFRCTSDETTPAESFSNYLFIRAVINRIALARRRLLPYGHRIAMSLALPITSAAVRETFRAWNTERESLDAQLNESLAALSAYQSHLDGWQQQLARERDELRAAREQLDRDRADAHETHAESSAAVASELNAAREKITALTTLLLNRTEELRSLDNRRAEVQTELELARARERELKAALDEHTCSVEEERSQWAEELRQLREVVERQIDAPEVQEPAATVERPAPPAKTSAAGGGGAPALPRQNPVLGSIVEQFGKLRQQRAVQRQATSKSG